MEDDSLGLQQTQRPARVDESALVFQFVISIVSDLFVRGRRSIKRGSQTQCFVKVHMPSCEHPNSSYNGFIGLSFQDTLCVASAGGVVRTKPMG